MLTKNIHGFTVTRQKQIPELAATLYQMTHEKTGLELVWLKRGEENKTFGIAFETLPWDDTGVFHILEHSVLCGSTRYPVKEPFVELLKSSMNTFLNAMTFPDKTFYPVSSRNEKDFFNLMRVYLDAVFCPLIYTKPEIFRQEGWHYELDEKGDVSYKGVVFNEMKGAFANADRLAVTLLEKQLFPDSPYGCVSGGDPAAIPDLTYEAFLDSHRRFYAPSNAYVYLDGDLDIEKTLAVIDAEYLQNYEKTERMAPPVPQKPVCGNAEGEYELAAGEQPEGKTRLTFGKVIGSFDEREKLIAVQVLARVLCGTNQSPLPKAILAAGLAEEVTMDVEDGIAQPWLMLDLKNLKEENLEAVEQTVWDLLSKLVDQGLDHSQLEAVMANTEFKLRERDYGYYPQGLIFGFNILESWLYGGDPAANLEVGDLFVNLKEKMQAGYFEQLIREVLLDNPHSARVVLHPSHTAGEARRGAEQTRLAQETAAWEGEDRAMYAEQQEKLMAWQNSTDTPEALATIPQLTLSDIPEEPERIPTEERTVCGIPVIVHPLSTGGIVYASLYLDADSCTEEELSCLSFLCGLLGESDTQNHTAEEILNRIRLLCGNFSVTPVTYNVKGNPNTMAVKLCVSFSTLRHNLIKAMELMMEILTQSRFDEESAHDILRQTKMQIFQRAVMSGNAVGLGRITAQFSALGVAEECIGGVSYHQWLKKQDEDWAFADLRQKFTEILNRILNRNGLTVSLTGVDEEQVQPFVQAVKEKLSDGTVAPPVQLQPWGKMKEGIAIPADIAFAVMGGDITEAGGAFSGQLQLAGQILSLGYLWNAIRVQGGAYGAGMVTRDTGLTACYSYRDPNGAGSVDSYRGCAAFLKNFLSETTDFTGFIIGTVSNYSPLMTPKIKAAVGDKFFFCRTSWEDRCRTRKQLLGATAEELAIIAEQVNQTIGNGGICMIGGQTQLDKCGELNRIITL